MAAVKQMKKIAPLITCEIAFGQHVCELVFGVDVPNLNLGIWDNPIKKTNPEQLCGFLTHVSLLDFGLYLSSQSRLHCPQKQIAWDQIEKISR